MLDISPPAFRGGQYLPPAIYQIRVAQDMRKAFQQCVSNAEIHAGEELAK